MAYHLWFLMILDDFWWFVYHFSMKVYVLRWDSTSRVAAILDQEACKVMGPCLGVGKEQASVFECRQLVISTYVYIYTYSYLLYSFIYLFIYLCWSVSFLLSWLLMSTNPTFWSQMAYTIYNTDFFLHNPRVSWDCLFFTLCERDIDLEIPHVWMISGIIELYDHCIIGFLCLHHRL